MDDVFRPLDPGELASATLAAADAPPDGWTPIVPVPSEVKGVLPWHHLGKPSAHWVYFDAAGNRLFVACRFDPPGQSKSFASLTFRMHVDGRTEWRWKGLECPRPLYGLDRLAARPAAPVIVCEGEKSADAAGRLFPDCVAVTSPNGAKSADKADWKPLADRAVTIWPDHDAEGSAYADDVRRLALAAGAASVSIVSVPDAFPPKWDLADDLPAGCDLANLGRLLKGAIAATSPPAAIHNDVWPELVRLDAPNLPPIDASTLPTFAGAFVSALAEATETPPALAVGMVLATCATAAARRFRVMVKQGYFEPLNLWCAVALPPGNRKSSVQSAAAEPLVIWEAEQAEAMKDSISRATSERRTQEARIKELRSKAAKADDKIDAANLAREAAELEAALAEIPVVPRLWTSDATPEKLGTLLADYDERIAWLSSEGGLFEMLQGRYSGGIPNLDLILKSHSGDADRVDRTSRPPVFLSHPLLSIGLSPQPDVLRGLASKPGFRGRGLLGRFLYLLPPSPLGHRTLDTKPIPQSVAHAYAAGVHAILDADPAYDDDGKPGANLLRLTPEAHAEWHAFALHIERQMLPGGDFEMATDWAGKAPGTAARLAGVLHVIEHAHGSPKDAAISLDTMGRALELMAAISRHSLHALDLMATDETMSSARRVWAWIEAGRRGQFPLREAYQSLKSTFPRIAGLRIAIDALAERGYLDIGESVAHGRGRPSSPLVTVRPDLARGWR